MSRNRTLVVYDVSPFIYIGNNVKGPYSNRMYGFPIQGVYYLLKHLSYDLNMNRDIVLCFDSRSFRKDLMKKYKSHRIPNPEIFAQIDMLYDYLSKCGIVCHKQHGYEADDLIYNVVEANKNLYQEVIIYGVDYDLAHNVSSNVRFDSISSQVLSVDEKNFSKAMVKDEIIIFNSITPYKVFNGDKSDGVAPFKTSEYSGYALYKAYIDNMTKALEIQKGLQLRDKEVLEIFIEHVKGIFTEEEFKELKTRLEIFYPAKLENEIFKEVSHRFNINMVSYLKFLSTLNDSKSLRTLGEKHKGPSEDVKSDLLKRGRELTTGEYAVDRNIVDGCVRMNSETLFVKGF